MIVRGTTTALVREQERLKAQKKGTKTPSPQRREQYMRLRLGIMTACLLVLFGFVLHRFYDLQLKDEMLSARAQRQVAGTVTLGAGGENHLDGHRGYIYDRNGFELAISVEVPSLFAHPRQIKAADKPAIAARLAEILNVREADLLAQLERDVSFLWLARKITPAQGERIAALKLPGIGLKRESKRYYPGQEIAGQILGFAGLDNVGLAGIESAWDKTLRGGQIALKGLRDARGNMLLTLETPMLNELEGASVVLTIDQHIQRVTETALERAVAEFGAKGAMAVVMDPDSGELLALASYPRFNPNRFQDYTADDWRNRAVLDVFEPGSVTKPLLYALALEAGVLTPHEPIDAERGRMEVSNGIYINDTHTVPNMDAEGTVVHSSNIGSYKIAKRLGKERFYQGLLAFGFGQATGVGVPGESGGILRPPKRWYEIDFANIAFGQGMSTSPLQLAVAFSVIANGGELVRPMLFREVRDRQGNVVESWQPEVRHRVVSEKTAAQTRQALEKVVTEGTALRAWVDGYRVGGKTGTPQKAKNGRYVNKWMANFVGMAPIEDPDLVVVVMVDEPRKSHLGGMVAAPVFAEIVSQVLPYRGVYPSEVYRGETAKLPTLSAATSVPSLALTTATPAEDEEVALVATASEPLREGMVRVPDFAGKTLREALEEAASSGVIIEAHDTGFVAEQWPTPGTQIEAGSTVQLTLARRYRQTHLGLEHE